MTMVTLMAVFLLLLVFAGTGLIAWRGIGKLEARALKAGELPELLKEIEPPRAFWEFLADDPTADIHDVIKERLIHEGLEQRPVSPELAHFSAAMKTMASTGFSVGGLIGTPRPVHGSIAYRKPASTPDTILLRRDGQWVECPECQYGDDIRLGVQEPYRYVVRPCADHKPANQQWLQYRDGAWRAT